MTRTVLVVEDTDVCRDALEIALTSIPAVEIRMVETAEQALLVLAAESVSALVTDLRLPRMDGFELIAAVRSHPQCSALPVLVISGDCDPGTPARLADLGANAFFEKPYSPAEVRAKLEQLLNAS
jgi:two-component system, chemotaxis family, chemotaxis protein CheY